MIEQMHSVACLLRQNAEIGGEFIIYGLDTIIVG